MKKLAKYLPLLLCLLRMVSLLSSCIDFSAIFGSEETPPTEEITPPGEEEPPVVEGWTPSGETITVATSDAASGFKPVVSTTNKNVSKEAMTSLIDLLAAKGLKGFSSEPVDTTAESAGWELIIGQSDREASVAAKALLDEKSAATPNDLHWVFHYHAGKLAIIANSAPAYEMALEDLAAKYISGGSFSFTDTLKDYGTMTKADYNAPMFYILPGCLLNTWNFALIC